MGYAFISYSSKNQITADSIRELLYKRGIETWMAPYDIPAGRNYAEVITNAIRECGCFVLILSKESQESVAVDSEVELAVLTFKKPIVTIQIDDVELNDSFTFYIHNKHFITVNKIDANSPEMERIYKGILAFVGTTEKNLYTYDHQYETRSESGSNTPTVRDKKHESKAKANKHSINIRAQLLIDILDNMDEGRLGDDTQEKRISVLDKLCMYLDDRDVLFRVTSDLLLYGPVFGAYFDIIIPHFKSDEIIDAFIEYCENIGWYTWREDVNKLLEAIESKNTSGLYIVDGVLRRVYRDSDIIIIPDAVHTIGKYSIGNYEHSRIKYIVLPNSIRHIEDAFLLRYKDFEVIYRGSVHDWEKIEIGENQWSSTDWFKKINVSFDNE